MTEFDINKWKEEQVYSTYTQVKEKLDSVDRQIEEAKRISEELENVRKELWGQMQELKRILRDEFGREIL